MNWEGTANLRFRFLKKACVYWKYCPMYRICYFLFLISFIPSFAQNNSSLVPFQDTNTQYGYKDESGRIGIEAQFDEALPFTGNYAFAKKGGLWGLITSKGKWAVPASYEDIGWTVGKASSPAVSGEVTGYKQNAKWGLISARNKILTPPDYDVLMYLSDTQIKAGKLSTQYGQTDTLFGLLDTKGKELIPCSYHSLTATSEANILLAGKNHIYKEETLLQRYGLISTSSQVLVPPQYKTISQKNAGVFEAASFPSFQLYAKGQLGGKFDVDSLYEIAENTYAFLSGAQVGLLTPASTVLQASMEKVFPERNGFVLFRKQGKYGAFTRNQDSLHIFLPPRYDSLAVYPDGLVLAGIKGTEQWEWQLINKNSQGEQVQTGQSY